MAKFQIWQCDICGKREDVTAPFSSRPNWVSLASANSEVLEGLQAAFGVGSQLVCDVCVHNLKVAVRQMKAEMGDGSSNS